MEVHHPCSQRGVSQVSNISVNTITDASGGSTASINGLTPQASNMQPYNLIINGAMTVAQRGTSAVSLGVTSGYQTVDRWQINTGGTATAGRLTMSQDSDAPEGFGSCVKLACTTADTSIAADENLRIATVLEGQNLQAFKKGTANAESMTLSFYVKGNASATYVIELYDSNNARHICSTFSVTTSWERVTVTFAGDTSGTFNNDNGGSLRLHLWLHSGSNYNSGTLATAWAANNQVNRAVGADSFYDSTNRTFYITGVQLEVGPTASSFAHENYSDTLRKCQRYFVNTTEIAVMSNIATQYLSTTTRLNPVPMRTTPSLSISGTWTFNPFFGSPATSGNTPTLQRNLNDNFIINWDAGASTGTMAFGEVYNATLSIIAEL